MAQVTDYTVSNQTFPNTRADLNNIFAAIATNNSGTSAPSNQQAGQWWIDTTSSTWILYIHDGTDDIQFATIDTSANTVNFTDSALDVVTDTTPQLGGNLDLNSNDITGTGNINITGNITATQISIGDSHIILDDVNDNLEINSSTDEDIKINSARNVGNDLDHTSAGGTRSFQVTSQGESKTHLFLNTGGDFSLYEDTGTSAKFFWDASNEGVALGSSQLQGDWGTFFPALEIGGRSALYATSSAWSGVPATNLGNNVSRNNSGTLKYIESDPASLLSLDSNKFVFYQANTGTAGNTISFTEAMRIDSSGNVGIGTSSPLTKTHILNGADAVSILYIQGADTSTENIGFGVETGKSTITAGGSGSTSNALVFRTSDAGTETERMRIHSAGHVAMGDNPSEPSPAQNNVQGFCHQNGDETQISHSGLVMMLNRKNTDGDIIEFRQDATAEGTISVSGSTVSYNGFTGTHWSRLADNSKPTILKGTILESLDEMMDWYQVEFDITRMNKGIEETITIKRSYELGDGESVGDVITYNFEETDYQATIIQESDVKHVKCKVSDTVDAKNVYGVFMDWDNDDDTVNDIYVAQTGTFVVRMNSAETVSKGDLIQSNGDGTGKVQADDIIRSSTMAKILSTTKIETYEDGSYIVPCSLHC